MYIWIGWLFNWNSRSFETYLALFTLAQESIKNEQNRFFWLCPHFSLSYPVCFLLFKTRLWTNSRRRKENKQEDAHYFFSLFAYFSLVTGFVFPFPEYEYLLQGKNGFAVVKKHVTLPSQQGTVTALIITSVPQLLDVNECVPVSDCMHKCKNYDGGYSCSCNDFFKVDPVNSKNCIRTYISGWHYLMNLLTLFCIG